MRDTLMVLNQLAADHIIGEYAIGGAVGATFYLEPLATLDLDIFVIFDNPPLILTLTPIYDWLRERGFHAEGDAVRIHGWPVQFLPASSPLLEEAVREAQAASLDDATAQVMSAEHLMAIALQTGRAKDHARLVMFVESKAFDEAGLQSILARHRLTEAWQNFKTRYFPAT
jgi:hypothetical protein